MLKRRLEALDVDGDLSLRRRKLDQQVSQALWRLQLIDDCGDWTVSYFSSRPAESGSRPVSVRKAWLARTTPSVQLWYAGHNNSGSGTNNNRRKVLRASKKKCLAASSSSCPVDPLLMNRLLAQPQSLMVMSMGKSRLSAARQVADMYHLWTTPEGRQLQFSLAHSAAVQDLQRAVSQKVQDGAGDLVSGLNHIRIPSAVEQLMSSLEQASCIVEKENVDQAQTLWIVQLSDLVVSASASVPVKAYAELLNFVVERAEGVVDTDSEPWRTLCRLAAYCREQLDQAKWEAPPVRSQLPFDVQAFRERIDRLSRATHEFHHLVEKLEESGQAHCVSAAFEKLNEALQAIARRPTRQDDEEMAAMSTYLQHLVQLTPLGMRQLSASRLLQHDLSVVVMQRLKDDPSALEDVEAGASLIGIQLPSFVACRLAGGSPEWTSTDDQFVRQLLAYLQSRSPLLAQVVDLQLEMKRGSSFLAIDPAERRPLVIFRRYLERRSPSKRIEEKTTKTSATGRQRSRPLSILSGSSSPVADLPNSADLQDDSARLASLILEVVPVPMLSQLEHLVSSPLLLVEQLLMNSQMGLASDVARLVQLNAAPEDAIQLNQLFLRYAAKALALGLPDIPSSPNHASHLKGTPSSSSPLPPPTNAKKKNGGAFVLPAAVPAKDQWVADAEVSLCPCCQTVQFSIFDRRHHCRRCGRVVCSQCSPHRRLVDGYGDVPVRTCVDCFSVLKDRPDVSEVLPSVRMGAHDGQILWRLSLDHQHNQIARREFSYEHAPNLALALAMVHLCRDDADLMANFLLDQSSSMLATLHRYLLHGTLLDVCSDPLMMFSLIKSLILSAKMRYSEMLAAPVSSSSSASLNKSKPARGLARCDALLGQIDLLSLLSSANCLHLLPAQPLGQLDTWRKLRDRLIDVELWSLALDVSTKAGLDAGSVWAAWGLVCLKAGNFQGTFNFIFQSRLYFFISFSSKGARQRFQRCLKPAKTSPLLQEILSVLENLSIPSNVGAGVPVAPKKSRRISSSSPINSPTSSAIMSSDSPQLIVATLARLGDICSGHLAELEEKNCTLEEILFYLDTYGEASSSFAYLVEKSCRIDMAVQRYAASRSHSLPDVFNQGLLLPCLRSSRLEDLLVEMKRQDASFHSWKSHLLAAAALLESKSFWNCLYQFHCLVGDWIRAALVAIRRLYLTDLFSVETLVARSHLLQDISSHLSAYLGKQPPQPTEGIESDKQVPLWWPVNEVITLRKTVQLQMKVTAFLDTCLKEGKLTKSLLTTVQSLTQSTDPAATVSPGDLSSSSTASGVFHVPTLLGSRQFRCSSAVLVTTANPCETAFELAWRICCEMRVRLDRYFRLSAWVLIRQGQVPSLILLVGFIKLRMTDQSVGYFDMDELLVECATLAQDRDKEAKSPDMELIVQQIRQPKCKIAAFVNLGWLKAAYLLAVKNGLVADVISIQQEATRLEQTAVLTLCDKWLRARNAAR